jgi:hypothetical protein
VEGVSQREDPTVLLQESGRRHPVGAPVVAPEVGKGARADAAFGRA